MRANLPSRIGRFEVLHRIGRGGMGIVYLARDPVLERSVAIKVLSVHNPELLERFGREARSAASLMHHNIVTIYDIGEDEGSPFIAMEYVDGETLAEVIRRRSPLSLERKLELILQLCDGLGHAHRTGIIHRDIKPANLMITSGGELKILDFGLARLVTDETMAGLTLTGALMGTPHYMSPEQIEGQRVDHRGDIFAVGLVIYELLTYCKAYPGDGTHSVLQKIMHTDPQPMHELQSDIDPELEQLVSQAIEKSPDRRYQQLSSLAKDLSQIRDRLRRAANELTVSVQGAAPTSSAAGGPLTPSPSPGPSPNLDAIVRRRTAQIDAHVTQALQHFQSGRLEAAIEQCEHAILLDPNDVRALDLLKTGHRALEDRQIRAWLDEAQTNLSHSALTAAAVLIEKVLQLRPESPEAQLLQRTLHDRRREQERAQERVRKVRAAIDRALVNLRDGALEAAARSTAEALAYDPDNEEGRALRQQVTEVLEDRRQKEELDQRASAAISAARRHASAGEHQQGLLLLQAFSPSHPLVEGAAAEIAAEAARLDQRRRSEEEARQRARAEEEARQRARAEEEARQRARAEEEARQRARAEEEARQRARAEEEARQRARAEAEATERHLLEAEERRQQAERAAREREEARRQHEVESRAQQHRPTAGEAAARHELGSEADSLGLSAEEAASSGILEPGFADAAAPAPSRQSPTLHTASHEVLARPRRAYLLVASAVAVVVLLALAGRLLWPSLSTTSSSVSETSGSGTESASDTPTRPAVAVPVPVTINAVPWANVRIVPKNGAGGAREGTTPLLVRLQEGEYTLELRNELFQATSQPLTVGQAPQSVSVVMPGANVESIVIDVLGPAQ